MVSEGNRRLVFEHPDDPALLVKVMKPGSYRDDGQPLRLKYYKRRRREGVFAYFVREIAEYVALRISGAARGVELPICPVYGIVETSLALGLVVEKITDRGGNLAPTLRDLIERRAFDAFKKRKLSEFLDTLVDNHVVVYELSADNIVFAEADGGRFICVDGMGSRTLIPIHTWSKTANAWNIRKLQRGLEAEVDRIRRPRPRPGKGPRDL